MENIDRRTHGRMAIDEADLQNANYNKPTCVVLNAPPLDL